MRTSGGGTWANFGGCLEKGEDFPTGALREVEEEIGLTAGDLEPMGCCINDHGGWEYRLYFARPTRPITDADIKLDLGEHSKFGWFTHYELVEGSPRFLGRPLLGEFGRVTIPHLGFILPPDYSLRIVPPQRHTEFPKGIKYYLWTYSPCCLR
ncbi:hypothetical protein GGR52DRAFT_341881 [Hypoxylon sp. FL1284]|nr:hypothetical protein GGR52DRAFT_341881 [Hypoxylon sp. FL1284]